MISRIVIFLCCIVLTQNYQDARMLGLGGAYCTLSSGYRAVGVNPANINNGTNSTINIFSSKSLLLNNFFNLTRYNQLNGAHFDNPLTANYYPKQNILNILNGEGLSFSFNSINSIPGLNFSKNNYAFTSNAILYGDIELPQAFIDIMFFGNEIGKELNMSFNQNLLLGLETGFSYCHNLDDVNIGWTVKYLQGIYYSNMEELEEPYFKTDTTAFVGQGSYLIKQGLGGLGFALDLGLSTDEFQNGMKYGVSITNAFSSMEWNNSGLMESIDKAGISFPVREKEYLFLQFSVDSLNAQAMLDATVSDIFNSETYKIAIVDLEDVPLVNPLEVDELPLFYLDENSLDSGVVSSDESLIDSDRIVLLDDGRVVIPTENLDDLSSFNTAPFKTDYPTYLRFGLSKNFYSENILVAADIMTGLDSSLGNEDRWKLAVGVELNKNPKIPLRFGLTLGGKDKYRFNVGTGYSFGSMKVDFAYGYIGALSINNTRGVNLALNLFYDYKEPKEGESTFIDRIRDMIRSIFTKKNSETEPVKS